MRIRNPIIFGCWIRIRIRIRVKSWIRIRIKVKIQKLTMETWRQKMDPWKVYRSDSHHCDEEQDLDPHKSEKLFPDAQPAIKEQKEL